MEMINKFTVTARCRLLDEEATSESYNDIQIELELDKADAMGFLFKFTPFMFQMSNGKQIFMKFGDDFRLTAMILLDPDNNKKYIVVNPQQVWTEILEAYDQIRLFDKIQALSSIVVPELDSEE